MRTGTTLRIALSALAAPLAALLLAGPAAAGERSEALEALSRVEALIGHGSGAGATASSGAAVEHPSEAIHRLVLAYEDLPASAKARARALLARPSARRPKVRHLCGVRFCVHWLPTGPHAPSSRDADGSGKPDYVETVLAEAERSAVAQNDLLGWREPRGDGRVGGGSGKVDIYIERMRKGVFGYTRALPPRRGKVPHSIVSFMSVDKNFSSRRYKTKASALSNLRVTIAHEYNHVLQYSLDAYQEAWFMESTATWMENLVYPEVDDYHRYVRDWSKRSPSSMTDPQGKVYGSAVWNIWLAAKYGAEFVRDAWAEAKKARPKGFSVSAYQRRMKVLGVGAFADNLLAFAADTAEWRTGKVFPEGTAYPDVRRQGKLSPGGGGMNGRMPHTGFALFDVKRTADASITLQVSSNRRVPTGVALVGRSALGPDYIAAFGKIGNGSSSVTLANPGGYARLTAVVVNGQTKPRGYSPRLGEWVYFGDPAAFRVKVKRGG